MGLQAALQVAVARDPQLSGWVKALRSRVRWPGLRSAAGTAAGAVGVLIVGCHGGPTAPPREAAQADAVSARSTAPALSAPVPNPASGGPAAGSPAVSEAPARRSGFDFMTPSTQALQRDDSANPGMLWVQGGQQRFDADCKACHTTTSLRGVAGRYPAFDAALGKPVTLAGRINLCRQRHVGQSPWPWESEPLLELEAFVALQSRGLPLSPVEDPRLQAATRQGQHLWQQPLGQLQLSCAQCHDQQAGRRLAGSTIPQAHATGYPLYRLEWQGMGSLQRRLRGCMSGVRAEAFAYGADEWVALELWLRHRAAGLPLESPAVRP